MITLENIKDARERIAPVVHHTPILTSEQLSAACGQTVFLKGEHLQKTGAFKIRGATNKVTYVSGQGGTSVVTASSGNHGQAVAYIAQQLGIDATVVVPEDATSSKLAAIRTYGGSIVTCGVTSEERIAYARDFAAENDAVFIPPYDDPFIMAGQGTIGLELLDQLDNIDAVVVPVGGGGLISGIATAIKEVRPEIDVIGVEPANGNDTYLSLQAGQITSLAHISTIADGLRTSQPGNLTFPVVQRYVDELVLVEEEEIKQASYYVWERLKQVIEPSAAVSVAAVMSGKINKLNARVVCVLSGGNTTPDAIGKW